METKADITLELVKKAQGGDTYAFENLLKRSERIIRNVTFRLSIPHSEIEDVLQEVRIKIFKTLSHLKKPEFYPLWLKRTTNNLCIDVLRKKTPIPFTEIQESGEDTEPFSLFDSQSLDKDSTTEFGKIEEGLERRERFEIVATGLDPEDVQLLKMYYIDGYTLEELSSSGNVGKSVYAERVGIAKAEWILEESKHDWDTSEFKDARDKLSIIVSDFKPDEKSVRKRYILASALSRLGDIYQVTGKRTFSIDSFLRSKDLWEGLHEKTMTFYALHMIALCKNIDGKYPEALQLLEEVREGYGRKDTLTNRFLGDLERDMGSIYLNMNEIDPAKLHIENSLNKLEDVDHRESYYAALRKHAEVQIRLKQLDKAHDNLQASIKYSPPYRALHHVQTEIALVDLFLSSDETSQALEIARGTARKAKEYGFLGQLSKLNTILAQHSTVTS